MRSNSPGFLIFEIADFYTIILPIYNIIVISIPFSKLSTLSKWKPFFLAIYCLLTTFHSKTNFIHANFIPQSNKSIIISCSHANSWFANISNEDFFCECFHEYIANPICHWVSRNLRKVQLISVKLPFFI